MPKSLFSKKKTRLDPNDAGRRLKKKRKHKGLPSGHRHSLLLSKKKKNNDNGGQDSRVGSKKLIPLFDDANKTAPFAKSQKKDSPQNSTKLSLEEEFNQLENDPKLEQLLDRIESNIPLTKEDQHYVDSSLARLEDLMVQLGYDHEDDEHNDNDIMKLLKS